MRFINKHLLWCYFGSFLGLAGMYFEVLRMPKTPVEAAILGVMPALCIAGLCIYKKVRR